MIFASAHSSAAEFHQCPSLVAAFEGELNRFCRTRSGHFKSCAQYRPLRFGDKRLDVATGELALGKSKFCNGLEVDVADEPGFVQQQNPVAGVIADHLEVDQLSGNGAVAIVDETEVGESRRQQWTDYGKRNPVPRRRRRRKKQSTENDARHDCGEARPGPAEEGREGDGRLKNDKRKLEITPAHQ